MNCSCVTPLPVERATRKGAARTECARCGLQVRIVLKNARGGLRAPTA